MDYSYYFNVNPDYDKLKEFGFENIDGKFIYRKDYVDLGLYSIITIAKKLFDVKVFDIEFGDEYLPFYSSTSDIKAVIEKDIEEMVDKCFSNNDKTASNLISYMNEKYDTIFEYPWDDVNCTFKAASSKKWYALLMRVSCKALKLKGDFKIDVLNIKLDENKIPNLIDNVEYYPAYHMNKKYWISILINKNTNLEKLYELIDESYNLVK